MITLEKNPTDASAMRSEWLRAIDDLYQDVEGWAKDWLAELGWNSSYGWDVLRTTTEVEDDFSNSRYVAPVLEINALTHLLWLPPERRMVPEQKLVFTPIFLNLGTGTGWLDLTAWPTHYRVRFQHDLGQDDWIIKTDSGLKWPNPWGRDTFVELAEGLLEA